MGTQHFDRLVPRDGQSSVQLSLSVLASRFPFISQLFILQPTLPENFYGSEKSSALFWHTNQGAQRGHATVLSFHFSLSLASAHICFCPLSAQAATALAISPRFSPRSEPYLLFANGPQPFCPQVSKCVPYLNGFCNNRTIIYVLTDLDCIVCFELLRSQRNLVIDGHYHPNIERYLKCGFFRSSSPSCSSITISLASKNTERLD